MGIALEQSEKRSLADPSPKGREGRAFFLDPLEVMVSNLDVGAVPMHAPIVQGEDAEERMAILLQAYLNWAIRCHSDNCLLVDYEEFPQVLWEKVLPHFDLHCDQATQVAARALLNQDAKVPGKTFVSDSKKKRASASPRVKEVVSAYLDARIARLTEMKT